MDCFLSEGIEIIFRIALTLLTMGKHELLLLDMEGVIKVNLEVRSRFLFEVCAKRLTTCFKVFSN